MGQRVAGTVAKGGGVNAMEANIYSLLVFGVPVLAAPVALIWGLRKALIGVLGVAALMVIAPFLYFGVWALHDGEPLWATLKAVAVMLTPMSIVLGWMLGWSAAYGALAATLRLGWLYYKGALT